MERRGFLRVVSGAVAGGLLAGPPGPASGQAPPAGRRAAGAKAAAEADAVGVSAGEVRVGMTAAFSGTAASLGSELYRGAQAYYAEINARGGVYGRAIRVVALDDRYEPDPCMDNTVRLLEKESVFCLSNYVGTPTLTRALPIIKQYTDQEVVLVGNFTGAQPQREPPYADFVFNVRASYRQEMAALVDLFWQAGARRFGVYYQIDAYGRSGVDGVARGLAAHKAKITAEATYARGAKFEDDMSRAVQWLQQAGVEVVLCTGAYQGCGAFVRAARDAGWRVPISNLSFVGSEALLRLLVQHGRTGGRDYTRALVNSQVVPSHEETSFPGVLEYRPLMDRHNPKVPDGLADTKYVPDRRSFISFEGFLNAKVIVEALRRTGPQLTRAGFRQALESLKGLDLGIGTTLTFTPERHQGLDAVYFTRVDGDRWVPTTDGKALMSA